MVFRVPLRHGFQKRHFASGNKRNFLRQQNKARYNREVHETLIDLGIFLVGAGGGAVLRYLADRRLLRAYKVLVKQLSAALQEQVAASSQMNQRSSWESIGKHTYLN